MPFDAQCKDCWNHGDSDGVSGQCRALPPDQPRRVQSENPNAFGVPTPTMTYRLTNDTEPACALYRPLVEPEAPPPETKAERIARLCRAGNVSVAEIKRAIDGR